MRKKMENKAKEKEKETIEKKKANQQSKEVCGVQFYS